MGFVSLELSELSFIKTVIYLEVVHKTNTSELLVVTKRVKRSGLIS